MRPAICYSLMRMIPPELQGKLSATMLSGNEIAIQNVYRIEDEFMAVRGRLSGTMDQGSVIFIPYEQIDYLGFRDEVKEPELQAMFAGNYTPAPKAPEQEAAAAAAPAAPTMAPAPMPSAPPAAPVPTPAAPTPPPPTPAAAPAAPTMQPTLPGKAALLERLRRSRENKPG